MERKTLTTLEAANIGRAMGIRGLVVHRDPTDRSLWQVVTPGRVETHEPMDEAAWREFLSASGWIDKPDRPARLTTYNAGHGRKVTVPENDEQAAGPSGAEGRCGKLFDAMREQLSPHAIAAIVAFLQPARTNNPAVDRQVRWFAGQLVELLGGSEALSRLADELGL